MHVSSCSINCCVVQLVTATKLNVRLWYRLQSAIVQVLAVEQQLAITQARLKSARKENQQLSNKVAALHAVRFHFLRATAQLLKF